MKAILLAIALLPTCLNAQMPLRASAQSPYAQHLSPLDLTLLGAENSLRALDATSTHRFENAPCHCWHEADPIAPDAKEWTPTIAFQAGIALTASYGYLWLSRHGHKKLARTLIILDIANESVAVGRNYSLSLTKGKP